MPEKLFGGLAWLAGVALFVNREFALWGQSKPSDSASALALVIAGWALWNTGKRRD